MLFKGLKVHAYRASGNALPTGGNIKGWKDVATSAEVGLQTHELNDFRPAFEGHSE